MTRPKITTKGSANRRQSLGERLVRPQAAPLQDAEVLELLLTYAIPRGHVRRIAEQLLHRFEDLHNVLSASTQELTCIDGVNDRAAALVHLVRELADRCSGRQGGPVEMLRNNREIEQHLLSRLARLGEERFLLIFLDRQDMVLAEEFVGSGTVDQVIAFPRQVMEMALRYRASSIIMAHNHLHGPPLPSVRDREEAERMRDILRPFDVFLRDALVVGQNRCFSIFANRPLV